MHKNLTLSQIIRLNTDFHDVPENVMFASQFCSSVVDHQCVVKMPVIITPSQQTVVIRGSDSPVTWADVVHSTGGIVIIAVAACAVLICVLLFILLVCHCVRSNKHAETKPSSVYLKSDIIVNESQFDS